MRSSHGWCEVCQEAANWHPVPRASTLVGVDRRTVYRWILRGWVHSRLLPNGWRLVCGNSLLMHADGKVLRQARAPYLDTRARRSFDAITSSHPCR
jgi:hypothetical protein